MFLKKKKKMGQWHPSIRILRNNTPRVSQRVLYIKSHISEIIFFVKKLVKLKGDLRCLAIM